VRLGLFSIPTPWIQDGRLEVKLIMSKCIVVRAERMFVADRVDYVAISEHFRDLPPGEIPPEYVWTFSEQDGVSATERAATQPAKEPKERLRRFLPRFA
jgi:hypothetical protein